MSNADRLLPRIFLILQGAFLGMGMMGCSAYYSRPLLITSQDNSFTKEKQFLMVPFFPDKTDQCGPSALASVLAFWGQPIDPPALKKEIYLAQLKGSLSIDLLLAAQARGFKAHLYNGSIDDLKSELREGHPLVAFINRGFNFYPIGHYVVISGYDEARQGLYVHSGLVKNKFVTYKNFLGNWNKTQRSTLLILPPEKDKESVHAES